MVKKCKLSKQKRSMLLNIFCPLCKRNNKEIVKNTIEANTGSKDNEYITFINKTKNETLHDIQSLDINRSSQPLPDIPSEPKSKSKQRTPLIPDLLTIYNLPYYWGEMDRYEAESELKGLEEGTFLLRDSSQEDFLFSVSFNRFGRTIHARVDYFKGIYSFSQNLITADSLPVLLKYFTNSNNSMFYYPLCINPLNRRQPFTLQKLCIVTICSYLKYYEDAYELNVPRNLLHQLHLSSFKIPIHYYNFYNESLLTSTTAST